ncbi:hypothetical protein A5707_16375 [Mycobacterium kyorinense]|uniref:Uncharacterized protein n=1 Tax=Mycobacterium kyorinense TaxID=487514 RepID=A0A1A2ZHS1_9MYCO|nr:hypothetical protein [Mycobacterium kyorinense]OBI49790.1 hypothetical protein A5707_16375 [Mycobacterium kyorinense]
MTEIGKNEKLKPSTQFSMDNPWGAYWNALFPPRVVSPWIDFKRRSSGYNVARRLWDQREHFRRAYEAVYGPDPEGWPSQHPGVVLDEVLWIAHAACLRCRWFDARGHYMKDPDGLWGALALARRHETSDGSFVG